MSLHPAIGITGGVGCGKSEAGRLLASWGVAVCDADAVVHGLLAKGTEEAAAICRAFGESVMASDGAVDRKALAELVFGDEPARRRLEAILHPPVLRTMRAWVEEQRMIQPVAGLVPLLFEAGFTDPWDAVICIAARDEVVDRRVAAKGWPPGEAARRRAAQWPLAEKERRADVVVRNDGSREAFERSLREAWETVLKRRA